MAFWYSSDLLGLSKLTWGRGLGRGAGFCFERRSEPPSCYSCLLSSSIWRWTSCWLGSSSVWTLVWRLWI